MPEHNERSIWDLVDSVSILFMQAYVAARARAFGYPSAMVRVLAQRDHAYSDAVVLEREIAIFRSQRQGHPAKKRPHYAPKERAEILQLMRLCGWSAKETAARFVVYPNTIRNWKRALRDRHKAEDLVGAPPPEQVARRRSMARARDQGAVPGTRLRHTDHRTSHHALRHPDQPSLGAADLGGRTAAASEVLYVAKPHASHGTGALFQAAVSEPRLAHGYDSVSCPLDAIRGGRDHRRIQPEDHGSSGLSGIVEHIRPD